MGKHLYDLEVTPFVDVNNNAIAEAIEFYWGERCPDHEAGCPICEAWKQYDLLVKHNEAHFEAMNRRMEPNNVN
jgi:hypothetical protein